MRNVLLPAIALTNRLGYTHKLALLGALSLLATSVVTYKLLVSYDLTINNSRRELEGLALIKPFSRVVQLAQQHRGLSAGELSGIRSMHKNRADVELDLTRTIAVLENKLPAQLASSPDWQKIRRRWDKLRNNGLDWKAEDNISEHTLLIQEVLSIEVATADAYGLTLDPEISSSYLIDTMLNRLPDAIEHLGQIRAYGTLLLQSGKRGNEAQIQNIRGLVAQLEDALPQLMSNINKSTFYNPALQNSLPAASSDFANSTATMINLLREDVFTGRFATRPGDFFALSTTLIDSKYAHLTETILPECEALIQARIDRTDREFDTIVSIVLILLLVVIYFATGIYYATINSIQSLVLSAHAFARGDTNRRIRLQTRDEFKLLGDSFNEMASGFNSLLDQRKKSEELIWKQANYDLLTSLPNRAMFQDRIEQEIKKAHRGDFQLALLFIDLDGFKEVNDTLGHHIGDMLLVQAAQRIVACVREIDTVVRLGGDEFAVILSELDDASSILRIVRDILRQLSDGYQLNDEMVHISASIGITLYPDDATTADVLLKNADQAMYVAKNDGRNRFEFFTSSMQQAAQSRLRLINDLRSALAENQFKVYFQPIVNLSTGRIDKAEALIRWYHPQQGIISPTKFIPLAEETGLIIEIGNWVFKEAARQVKQWRNTYNPALQISVNMSPRQFHSADNQCYKTWFTNLLELKMPGQSIVIEITEGLLLGAENNVIEKLLEFRNAGIQISIDDFGTGYSSLSYLKKFDIDYIKIDQSFVRDLATDPNDMALSEAIIVMAHKLGLKVIAEGVETEIQRNLLAAAACDYAQGYLYSKPVSATEFETLLKENQAKFSATQPCIL